MKYSETQYSQTELPLTEEEHAKIKRDYKRIALIVSGIVIIMWVIMLMAIGKLDVVALAISGGICGGVLLLVLSILFFFSYRDSKATVKIRYEGILINKTEVSIGRGNRQYSLFIGDNTRIVVTLHIYNKAKEGDHIIVEYIPHRTFNTFLSMEVVTKLPADLADCGAKS